MKKDILGIILLIIGFFGVFFSIAIWLTMSLPAEKKVILYFLFIIKMIAPLIIAAIVINVGISMLASKNKKS